MTKFNRTLNSSLKKNKWLAKRSRNVARWWAASFFPLWCHLLPALPCPFALNSLWISAWPRSNTGVRSLRIKSSFTHPMDVNNHSFGWRWGFGDSEQAKRLLLPATYYQSLLSLIFLSILPSPSTELHMLSLPNMTVTVTLDKLQLHRVS